MIKTYFNLETSLSLPGISLFDCAIAAIGWIVLYKILPETEGRSLEDIEMHFSDNSKKLTDHNIPKRKQSASTNGRAVNEVEARGDDNL